MKTVALDPQPNAATSNKMFYRIQEVAKLTGLKPYILRYWESEFKELEPAKDAADQRRYRQSDIDVITAIRKLVYEDRCSIQDARARLQEELQRMRGAVAGPELIATVEIAAPAGPVVVTPRTAPEEPSRRIDASLRRLRMEVSELINMLNC